MLSVRIQLSTHIILRVLLKVLVWAHAQSTLGGSAIWTLENV